MGVLEVKCPLSKAGKTADGACADRNFCCALVNGEVYLKRNHSHYYQVQGQMAITGTDWCDFVIWTNAGNSGRSTHVERIYFDSVFWSTQLLPALLHFVKFALIPEVLTQRVRRRGKLCTNAKYVFYAESNDGYYVCEPLQGLNLKIRRIK